MHHMLPILQHCLVLTLGFGQRVFLSVEATPNFRTSLYVILGREFLYMLLSLYSTILLLLVT